MEQTYTKTYWFYIQNSNLTGWPVFLLTKSGSPIPRAPACKHGYFILKNCNNLHAFLNLSHNFRPGSYLSPMSSFYR